MASSVVFGCISPPTVPNIPRPQSPIQKLFLTCRRRGSTKPPSEEFHSSWISQKAAAGGGSRSYWFSQSRSHSWISAISVIEDDDDAVVFKQTPSMLPSRISPWLMLPPAFEEDGNMVYNFYSIKDDKVLSINKRDPSSGAKSRDDEPADDSEFIGSSHGWLVLYNRSNSDLFLSNPLSRRHIKLPPIRHKLPKNSSVILSSPPNEQDCRAILINGRKQRLAFCCPGLGGSTSTQWTPISTYFDDYPVKSPWSCVYSTTQKLFFCANDDYLDFEALDVGDPSSPKCFPMLHVQKNIEYPTPFYKTRRQDSIVRDYLCSHNYFLVVAEPNSTAHVLLVTRHTLDEMFPDGSSGVETLTLWDAIFRTFEYDADGMRIHPYKTIHFTVHKYDSEQKAFMYMEGSLDGLAIFVGKNHSFAMRASDFPELKPDSIYFTDVPALMKYANIGPDACKFGGHDIGIYNYKDKTLSPCYYPCDVQSIKRIEPAPMWFTPSPL